ncbi:caspase family protein, partial [Cylindrospermopsis raciborskii]|uniref:caspase family protein n=1 Tax=Cylindrospermopsis raciborskii TaxID=77022 RepID=UPI0022C048BE
MAKNWAIVIGINNYLNLQTLNFAQSDAEAMKEWFLQEAKFDQVFLFTENSHPIPTNTQSIPTEPTHGILKRFLRVNFEQPLLKQEDNLWFFFSGHGQRSRDKDYLMLKDTDPGDIESSAISVEYVTERLRRSGADNVILLLDACRSQGAKDGLGYGEEQYQGVITFYSCKAEQTAWEIPDLGKGAFTHTLLEGLRLHGEGNCATVERLYRHLTIETPKLNQEHGKPIQNPYLKAEPPYKMYYILLPKIANIRDIVPLKNEALHAEVNNDLELAEKLWIRVLAVDGTDNDALSGIKRITIRREQNPQIKPPGEGNTIDGQDKSPGNNKGATQPADENTVPPSKEPRIQETKHGSGFLKIWLKIALLVSSGLILVYTTLWQIFQQQWNQITNPEPTETSYNPNPSKSSPINVDSRYAKLETLLKAQNFRAADLETDKVILAVANREREGWLRIEDAEKFP